MNNTLEFGNKFARNVEHLTNVTYVGYADEYTLESDSDWIIKKISVINELTKIQKSGGSWNDRASLIYS